MPNVRCWSSARKARIFKNRGNRRGPWSLIEAPRWVYGTATENPRQWMCAFALRSRGAILRQAREIKDKIPVVLRAVPAGRLLAHRGVVRNNGTRLWFRNRTSRARQPIRKSSQRRKNKVLKSISALAQIRSNLHATTPRADEAKRRLSRRQTPVTA